MAKTCFVNALRFGAIVALFVPLAAPANASILTFQDLPTGLTQPPNISHHTVGGPVIADDFVPAAGGQVTTVEWWGSQPASTSWELVFQTNVGGHPNTDSPVQGGFALFFPTASGVADSPIAGLFHFTASISGGPELAAGTDYWLTIANFADNWNWGVATAGPTVGAENFNAHVSVGGTPCTNSGPHCGPWTDIHTDFAMRLFVVPEPSTFGLSLLGIAATLLALRKKLRG